MTENDQLRALRQENQKLRRQVEELISRDSITQSAIDSLPDLIMFKDADLRYQLVNESFRLHVNRPDDQIIGHTDFDLFPRAKAEKYRKDDEAVIQSGQTERRELPVEGKEDQWVEEAKAPIFDDEGRFAGLFVNVREITQKVLAKRLEARQHLLRSLRQITDNTPCVIHQSTMTPEEVPIFTFVSAGVKELYSLEPEKVVEDANQLFQYVHDDDAELLGRDLRQAFDQKGPWRTTFRVILPNGQLKWIETSATPQEDEDGHLVWNGFSIDISDRKKAEALREDIDRITRHDLKTPLSSIVMMAKHLNDDQSLVPEHARMAAIIDRAAGKMRDLINDSLNLYRMERGDYQLTRSPVNLAAVIDEISEDLESLRRRHHVKIVRLPVAGESESGDEFIIQGEELSLYSMLSNLIKNAVEASPPDQTVSVRPRCGEDGESLVEIHNFGTVPEGIRDRFFEKYATSGKSRGTGIGTYSAKLIAETHGGTLRMRSDRESGTTITAVLPT